MSQREHLLLELIALDDKIQRAEMRLARTGDAWLKGVQREEIRFFLQQRKVLAAKIEGAS